MINLGKVRMIHHLGGPPRELDAYQNGNTIFIYWPLSGLLQIVKSTGVIWTQRKGPWKMHPEDLKRIVFKHPTYLIR